MPHGRQTERFCNRNASDVQDRAGYGRYPFLTEHSYAYPHPVAACVALRRA
jgi:hypothetical protein